MRISSSVTHRRLPALATLVAVALLLRLLGLYLLAHANAHFYYAPDSGGYMDLARRLAAGGGFLDDARTPGYPLFLAPFVAAFGAHWVLAAILAQQGLVVATALLTWRLTACMFDDAGLVPLLAAAFVLFDPALWLHSYMLLTESLFTVLAAGLALALVEHARAPRAWGIAVIFALVVATTYVRPITLYLEWLLGVLLVLRLLKLRQPRLALVCVLCVLAAWASLNAWTSRNQRLLGMAAFTRLSSNLAYEYIGAAVLSRTRHRPWSEVRAELATPLHHMSPGEQVSFAWRRARAIIFAHPLVAARVFARGLLTNLADPGTELLPNMLGLRKQNSGLMGRYLSMRTGAFVAYLLREERVLLLALVPGAIWLALQYPALLAGLHRHRRAPGALLLIAVGAYLLCVASGPQSMARFRVPCVPLFGPFVASGLANAWRRVRPIGRRSSPAGVTA